MSISEPNKLDDRLRDWAAVRTPDETHFSAMQEQILNEWDAENQRVQPASATGESRQSLRSALAVGVAIGALAAAFVALLWNTTMNDHQADIVDNPTQQPPPPFAWLSDAHLADKKILRDEMLSMFDQKFGWIAETGENLEVGIDGRQHTGDTPIVAVRVIVERRNVVQGDWTTDWAVDVVALSEERVELTPQSRDFTDFRLWAYALPDGMVSLETELDKNGTPFVVSENLQRDGKPEVIYQTKSGVEEIRVLQSAAVL